MKKRPAGKCVVQAFVVFGLLCVFLILAYGYQTQEEPLRMVVKKAVRLIFDTFDAVGWDAREAHTPPQDADGYYLLSTKEDFRWFLSRNRSPDTNVRLADDIVLNDTRGWEEWEDTPPENTYGSIPNYRGHFDGNGHALEGYYAAYGKWQSAVFTTLEKDAKVTDLTLKNSLFRTTYEDGVYVADSGKTDVVVASSLCFANYGVIENCEVKTKVIGAWEAGGIAGINYGQMSSCRFTGTVEAGTDQDTEAAEDTVTYYSMFAGGICRSNQGTIRNCINEGTVTLGAISETFHFHDFAAGGICGRQSEKGSIEDSHNSGDVTSAGLAGGIAGASWGSIYRCQNSGKVHVRQVEREYVEALISAGICASNGGTVDTCVSTGAVTVDQKYLSFRTPVYGVTCNTVNPDKGTVTNSFYLKEKTEQVYPQRGVRGLWNDEIQKFSAYFSGEKRLEREDFLDFPGFVPYDPKTQDGDGDYVHLGFGPAEDVTYEVEAGDNLWNIAERFFGDGRYYPNLEWANPELADSVLLPGMQITVPHRDLAAVRRYDEEGIGIAFCRLSSGESCPTRFILSKPIDWYYGEMRFEASAGLDTFWPKTPDAAESEDIRIFYRVDANPDGDFFADNWSEVQESIRKSAAAYWGNSADTFAFDRYTLDNGEKLYCYSFVVYRKEEKLMCQTAYRLCDNMLVELIGIQPLDPHEKVGQSHDVSLRVPYMAAFVDTGARIEEAQWDPETFYGRENWDFPQLHNPFAIALAYDRDAECSPYVLFTGAQ